MSVSALYNVFSVAKYIINYSNEQNFEISNLNLQKLLYFVQAYFLCSDDTNCPCFDATINAWDFGPVVPVVYHEFKRYGAYNLPTFPDNFLTNETISKNDQEKIKQVVNLFSKYNATELVKLTCHQAPWREVYGKNQNNEISQESIREYFTNA